MILRRQSNGHTNLLRDGLWAFFVKKKFVDSGVLKTLAKYGFKPGGYTKVIVTCGWTPDAKEAADQQDITLWDFREIMREMASVLKG